MQVFVSPRRFPWTLDVIPLLSLCMASEGHYPADIFGTWAAHDQKLAGVSMSVPVSTSTRASSFTWIFCVSVHQANEQFHVDILYFDLRNWGVDPPYMQPFCLRRAGVRSNLMLVQLSMSRHSMTSIGFSSCFAVTQGKRTDSCGYAIFQFWPCPSTQLDFWRADSLTFDDQCRVLQMFCSYTSSRGYAIFLCCPCSSTQPGCWCRTAVEEPRMTSLSLTHVLPSSNFVSMARRLPPSRIVRFTPFYALCCFVVFYSEQIMARGHQVSSEARSWGFGLCFRVWC